MRFHTKMYLYLFIGTHASKLHMQWLTEDSFLKLQL